MIADLGLLLGAPLLFAGLLVWGTLTPGNPAIGLAIGWLTDSIWMGIGTYAAIQRYWPKRQS